MCDAPVFWQVLVGQVPCSYCNVKTIERVEDRRAKRRVVLTIGIDGKNSLEVSFQSCGKCRPQCSALAPVGRELDCPVTHRSEQRACSVCGAVIYPDDVRSGERLPQTLHNGTQRLLGVECRHYDGH